MEGYLGKKGKRIGSRIKRYMRLDGELLSNHHDADAPPTWRVNVRDATLSCNPKRKRIVINMFNNKLELYTDSFEACEEWYQALSKANGNTAKPGGRSVGEDKKENESQGNDETDGSDSDRVLALASSMPESESSDSKMRVDLGKNFKVVKPPVRKAESGASSSNSDEAYTGENPLVVHGQVYEETPASMIFKQFTFGGAK